MADFKTHLMGAAMVSGTVAAGFAMTRDVGYQEGLTYFLFGVVGGLLPDIDSENSVPIRIAQRVLSTVLALTAVLFFADYYSFVELMVVGLVTYAAVRYAIFGVFGWLTVHRGLVHSLPAGALFMVLSASLMAEVFAAVPLHAWLCGGFVALGYFVHLCLDEMYSIDLLGRRLKRSFGTALKLGLFSDVPDLLRTTLLYSVLLVAYLVSPPADEFIALVKDPGTYQQVYDRLLPSGRWFSGINAQNRS